MNGNMAPKGNAYLESRKTNSASFIVHFDRQRQGQIIQGLE